MEGPRTHTFPVIIFSFLFLGCGFLVGFWSFHLFHKNSQVKKDGSRIYGIYGNNIMTKRMQAIKAARKDGKEEYEFEVAGFYPVLGAKN